MKTHDLTKIPIIIQDEDQELYIDIKAEFEGIEEGDIIKLIRNDEVIVYSVNYILYDDETNNFTAGLLYLSKE